MSEKVSVEEKMATDDLPVSIILIFIGIGASRINYLESDWWGFFGSIVLSLLGVLWLSARIYHLTHKEEVFGSGKEKGLESED